MSNYNKIKTSLYAAAIGDALGAPTELRSIQQIKDTFGGLVNTFIPIPEDVFARGKPKGTVTDDFSLTYYLLKSIRKNNDIFDRSVAKKHVVEWSKDPIYFENFAGPTTRMAVENLKKGIPTDIDPFGLVNFNAKATNGVAMKVAPAALIAKTLDEAIENAIILSVPTHYNSTAMSGAAAISASIFEAMQPDATVDSIIEAGILGADRGKEFGVNHDHISVAPNLSYKIKEAVILGKRAKSFDELLVILETKVGTNIQVTESVPAVYAILSFTKGDIESSILAGVNCGGDTDTIASMVGAISGAYSGTTEWLDKYLDTLFKNNNTLNIKDEIQHFSMKHQ